MLTGARTISNNSFLIKSDRELRVAVKKRLTRELSRHSNSYVLEELGVRHGAARIDLVAVNGYLHGYELKSDADSLYRLPDQIRLYNLVFDKVTLVVGYKNALNSLKIIPDWWGVKLAHYDLKGHIQILDARSAHKNPVQDPKSVLSLLWREEALQILEEVGCIDDIRFKPKFDLYNRLANILDKESIRFFVTQALRIRKKSANC